MPTLLSVTRAVELCRVLFIFTSLLDTRSLRGTALSKKMGRAAGGLTGLPSALAKAGKLRLRGAGGQRGETVGLLPLSIPPFPWCGPRSGNGCTVLLIGTAPKKYGDCCGSSVRAEVRTGQRENGYRLSETVHARVTARGRGEPPPTPPTIPLGWKPLRLP